MLKSLKAGVCVAALMAAGAPLMAFAQDAASAPVAAEDAKADEDTQVVVVVGSRYKQKAIRSSNAISLFSPELLKELAPSSVGELVRSIPGFHAEDSGGEVGNNVAPRGFPLSTQTEFTALQRDGMVVFYNQDLLFSQSDRFTRMSGFVASAQAVRGGSSSVFVGSAPAGYINFQSREGRPGAEAAGDVEFETNSNGRFGIDVWTTGSLSPNTSYAIGGWWRADNSGRDPGFTANKGGELNANIRHNFANGKGFIKAEFNAQDDRAIFYLPQPLTGSTVDPKTIPGGMSIEDGTTGASVNGQFLNLPGTPNGDISWDLADGQRDKTTYFGTKLSYELGAGWTLINQNRYTDLYTPFNAIINVGNARSLSTIASEIYASSPTRFAGASSGSSLYFQIRDAGTGEVLATQATADSLNTNGYGIDAAYFYRKVEATNFQNDLQLQRGGDTFAAGSWGTTLGLFYSLVDGQVLDHRLDTLQSIEKIPRRLDIVFTNAGGTPLATGAGTYKGLIGGPTGFANVFYTETTFAPYVDFVYDIGDLSVNFGARYEMLHVTGQVENQSYYDLSSNSQTSDPGNPALTNLPFGNGTFRSLDLDFSELAWTIGANYKVAENFAVFARYAKGFRMPDADRYQALAGFDATTADGLAAIKDFNDRPETKPAHTTMVEAGLRYNSPFIDVETNYFFAQAEDLFFNVPTVVNGAIVQRQAFRNTRTNGVEAQLGIKPTRGWRVDVSATYQDPKFFDTPLAEAVDSNGNTVYLDINGNVPVRTPKLYYQLRSSYKFEPTPVGKLSVHTSWSSSGLRYADDANTARLPEYGMLNVGFDLQRDNGMYIRGEIRNALKSTGLTEGDPRAGETLAGTSTTFNARVVDPQLFSLRVGYQF